nr:phosphate/phosphite/phosphonate ABC transporter substrate-binding protein [uncultured Rhodoferax sp.]
MNRLFVLVFALLAQFAANVGAAGVYSFGPANQRSPLLTAQYWNPILNYVSQRSGVGLELQVASTGDRSSEATVRGDYDFVYNNHQFKPSAAAQGYSAILRPRAEDITGQIVTLEDSPIKNLNDLMGKTVGFANPQAFAGYTVQMDQLMRLGIEVVPVFGGSQQGIMAQLKSGNVIAAGVNSTVMREFAQRENLRYQILWQSQSYHDLAISVHPRVPVKDVEAVRKAFADMAEDPQGLQILEASAKVIAQKPPYGEWHLLWLPVVTMYLDFPASVGTRNL